MYLAPIRASFLFFGVRGVNINDTTKSLSSSIENISIRPVFSKLPLKQPNDFPQQPIITQNPPCNTLATVQTSNIKSPDP